MADVLTRFAREYGRSKSYWYVPKTRVLADANIEAIQALTRIIGVEFAHRDWNPDSQDAVLSRGRELGVLAPYVADGTLQDRTALIRIWKKLLEILGLVWIPKHGHPILTTAGARFLTLNPREVIEGQIAKYQYPNPGLTTQYGKEFKGLLPHLFILQVMQQLDYKLSVQEYDLFVNLARGHNDLPRIVKYIQAWRSLRVDEQNNVMQIRRDTIPNGRHRRIAQNSSYQRAFLTFPSHIAEAHDDSPEFTVVNQPHVDALLTQFENLKIQRFQSEDEWFAYYGNPEETPSWFTYVKHQVEKAPTKAQARKLARSNRQRLTKPQNEEIHRLEIEKGIEDYYETRLNLLEEGLRLVRGGRQCTTPIGRVDLLCQASEGDYVVVEIKAAEAADAVFGQILRYIGWVHRNLGEGVRGIILASEFPEMARYSRIGLLKTDAERFIQFKKHGF